mmetsp:Transcript_49983/g.159960  ORF Transcript_49983/g.159960 Transcript_49983/m.159960 type:complete len:486 (+) Transcript_49983:407-1864(+)|eukprot:CAMPEP_0182913686 /NCGR_PEP_ID=MMETSP0034_2-20130328/38168_1 /TAXON_ID=156128 /ORGANISM="Nephroselmis pyriformis, Strain CCMP717" /LENGTH=485 /DNA_ID=CAMNT_0025050415 /DNA_START=168 /DNA_END=1625 /DNA_ORIENTATION=-
MTDTEMKDADAKKPEEGKKKEEAPPPPKLTPMERLQANLSLIEKSVAEKETRLMGRVLRTTQSVRKELTADIVAEFLGEALPSSSDALSFLSSLASGDSGMSTDAGAGGKAGLLPEVEMYAYFLVSIFLIDQKKYPQAKECTTKAIEAMADYNRRTLDVIAARIFFYYSWSHECTDSLEQIRGTLLALHRTATLRHNAIGQETLLNLLLRNYLHYNLYDQAEKLRSKTQRPESHSNQQYARYLYYLGRIRAIQLEYTDAKECLQQAARKAPQAAHGFRVTSHKWLALVRLLLGEIPERTVFRQKGMVKALLPYFELTQAVRLGDLKMFSDVCERYEGVFCEDKTSSLIVRLRRNVIRTGLRRINLAYSRISLVDVAAKLGLAPEDAECIVAKAIRDGGIDATIDHEHGYMQSKEVVDIYSTTEPQGAFHARIAFCLDTHNEAVKAMRFPPDAHKKGLESAEARRERLQQEQELATAIAEEEEEEF